MLELKLQKELLMNKELRRIENNFNEILDNVDIEFYVKCFKETIRLQKNNREYVFIQYQYRDFELNEAENELRVFVQVCISEARIKITENNIEIKYLKFIDTGLILENFTFKIIFTNNKEMTQKAQALAFVVLNTIDELLMITNNKKRGENKC